ncbi:MAG: hypothetical protein EXS17_04450 [Phycisphaerales bacterium]|nr:hypothetical protein [Phycisphaerales bacterium]
MRAIFALARLGVTTRFRFGGAYWVWRNETAFGTTRSDVATQSRFSWRSQTQAVLEYGAWVARMRQLMK